MEMKIVVVTYQEFAIHLANRLKENPEGKLIWFEYDNFSGGIKWK